MKNIFKTVVLLALMGTACVHAQLKQNTVEIIPNSTRTTVGSIQFDGLTLGAKHVGFKAPSSIAADLLWELPGVDGSATDCIHTDGAHTLYFDTCGSGGGGGSFTAPFLIMTDYIFDVTVGSGVTGDLSAAGSNTITFTTCPLGVNGADANHDVRITGGTGTAESVRITGGSCVESAAGTLIFTTANTHTGSWHVTTSTSGLYEAFIHGEGGAPGRYIWASKGNWNLYSVFNTGGENGVCIVGAGVGATNFIVSSFKTTALGVLSYNFSNGGCLRDFSIRLTQPDSTNIADYTHWPPALYIVGTLNLEISNVELTGAWDALLLRANGNIRMNNVVGNAFHHFLDNDNGADTLDINGMHPSSAGLTTNQATVFSTETSIYAAYLGYQADAKIKNLSTNAAKCANFHQGTTNAYSSFGSGLDGLYGLDNWECDSPGFEVEGEAVRAVNMWFTTAGAARPQITQTGGSLQISNSHFYGTPGSSTSDISLNFVRDVNDGFGAAPTFLLDNSILTTSADGSFITATFTGYASVPTVTLRGNQFQRVPQSTWTQPLIAQTAGSGGGQIHLTVANNNATYKTSGTGTFISLANDYPHVITGNTASGWDYSLAGTTNTVFWGNAGILSPINVTHGPFVLGSTETITGSLIPTTTTTYTLGDASHKWNNAFLNNFSLYSTGYVLSSATLNVQSSGTLISNSGSIVTIDSGSIFNLNTTVTGSILPTTTTTYTLGDASHKWNNAFLNNVSVYSTSYILNSATLNIQSGGTLSINPGSTFSVAANYIPQASSTYDIGSGVARIANVYMNNLDIDGICTGSGCGVPSSGTKTITGLTIMDEISITNGNVIRPSSGAAVNLGSTGRRFAAGWIDALASVTGTFSSLLTTQSLAPASHLGGSIGAVGQAYYQTYTSQVIFPPSSSGGSVSIENNVGVLDYTGSLRPKTTGIYGLGDSTHRWSSIVGVNEDLSGSTTYSDGSGNVVLDNVSGNLEFTGGVKFNSLTQFGAGARLLSGQSLTTAGSSNLGASSSHFATAYIDTLVFTNLLANGNFGFTATKTIRNSAGTGTCTLIFDSGILIGGTC